MASTARREYGTGSITWLSSRRARLRVRVDGESGQRSKVIRVAHRDHGGRGEAATELENFVREIEAEQVQTENQVRTVGEVLTAYIEHCRRIGRRQGTVESYEMVAKRITTEMKARPIATITGHDFDEFYGDLGDTLGANTIRQTHAVLHAAFDQAVKWGWIAANPMTSATPPGRFRPKREALAMGDVHRMIQRASSPTEMGGEGDLVLAMAVILATITGARRGELAGLRWEDLNEDTCSVRIERQWVPGQGGSTLAHRNRATDRAPSCSVRLVWPCSPDTAV